MVWAPRSIELWLAAVLLLQHLDQRGAEAVVVLKLGGHVDDDVLHGQAVHAGDAGVLDVQLQGAERAHQPRGRVRGRARRAH